MHYLLFYKRMFSAGFLLLFLLSGNVLLYSTHLVAEIGHEHEHQVTASRYAPVPFSHDCSPDSVPGSRGGDQGEHGHCDGQSCCESHSHVSIHSQVPQMQFLPQVMSHAASEPARFIPEVYLDKFIPPQNLV